MWNGIAGMSNSPILGETNGIDFRLFLQVSLNSIMMGFLLGLATYILSKQLIKNDPQDGSTTNLELLLGSSNLIFITAGLASIMMLVQNNIARALAIASAIALMRFRVKMSTKSLDSPMLYGVVVGIACGLNEISVAWFITLSYMMFKMVLLAIIKIWKFSEVKTTNQTINSISPTQAPNNPVTGSTHLA